MLKYIWQFARLFVPLHPILKSMLFPKPYRMKKRILSMVLLTEVSVVPYDGLEFMEHV